MKGQLWLCFLGTVALLVGCSGTDGNQTQSESSPSPGTQSTEAFSNPTVAQAKPTGTVPVVPGLLQPTNPKARVPSIPVGRTDPFAAIPSSVAPIVVSSSRTTVVPPLPTVNPASATNLPPIVLPPVTTAPLPNPSSPGALPPALPPLNLPNTPNAKPAPVTPTSLAESIEVTGVVQVGGKWSVIVKEPHTSSSRYVSVGEYLGNGRVLVKKILSPGTTEPVVVLQQNGVEIRKTLV